MADSEQFISDLEKAVKKDIATNPENIKRISRQLKEFSLEIETLSSDYMGGEFSSWIVAEGDKGRDWNKEIRYAIKKRPDGYIPQPTYPRLNRGYIDVDKKGGLRITAGLEKIEEIVIRIQTKYPDIAHLAQSNLNHKRRQFLFLGALLDGNEEEAARHLPWDLPTEELIQYAHKVYGEDMKPKPPDSPMAKTLKAIKFHSGEIKAVFEYATGLLGIEGFKWIISSETKSITISTNTMTGKIPLTREVNGITLLSLVNHEIGVHLGVLAQSLRNGFGTASLGIGAGVIHEGIAKLVEEDVEEMILGYSEPPGPYRVLGIARAIENGGDFWDTFDYLVSLREAEYKAQGKDEKFIEKNKYSLPITALRRIFSCRLDLSKKGYIRTSEKAYLEGRMIAAKIREKGLLGYLLAGKFDIPTVVYFLETGVIPKTAVDLTVEVAQRIWGNEEDRDFITKIAEIRENYNPPYWREYGITDKEYLAAWRKM